MSIIGLANFVTLNFIPNIAAQIIFFHELRNIDVYFLIPVGSYKLNEIIETNIFEMSDEAVLTTKESPMEEVIFKLNMFWNLNRTF